MDSKDRNNSQEAGLIFGFILGFGAFLAYDVLRDPEKRKKAAADIKKLSKKLMPYVDALRERVEESSELQEMLVTIDRKYGTELYKYIMADLEKLEEKKAMKEDSKKKKTKKRSFFQFK